MENQMEKMTELGLNSGPRALSPGHNHYTTQPHTGTHTHICRVNIVRMNVEISAGGKIKGDVGNIGMDRLSRNIGMAKCFI